METISIPMDYATSVGTDSQNTPGIRNIFDDVDAGRPSPLVESNDTMYYGMATPSSGDNTI
jgi:hypothetical protein